MGAGHFYICGTSLTNRKQLLQQQKCPRLYPFFKREEEHNYQNKNNKKTQFSMVLPLRNSAVF